MSKEYSSIIPSVEGILVQTLIDELEDYYCKCSIKILKYNIKNVIQKNQQVVIQNHK